MINVDEIENKQLRAKVTREISQMDSRARFAEIINDASIDQVLAYDTDKRLKSCNRTCAIKWEVNSDYVIGKNILEVFPVLTDSNAIMDALDTALAGFKVFVPHDKGRYDEGYYEHHFIPLKDDHDEVTGVLIIIHDVAHRIKAENELKQLNKSLAKKNKELKQRNAEVMAFSHVTSHDLKDPLHKIYSFIEIVLRDEGENFSEKGRYYFKRIQAAAQRMGLLTDDIFAFSLLNNNNEEKNTINLNTAMVMVKHNLSEQIIESGAIIETGQLPIINGYRSIITQLFQNILNNAIKFRKLDATPHIRIEASIEDGGLITHMDALPDVIYHKISIRDNGIGFEQKHADRVFQMFHQLHKDAYLGSGMGLANCKKICELHQGFMTVQSVLNEGSTFNCFLPVK